MRYSEAAPDEDLRDVVQALWTVEGRVGERVRILPDACVDLIALDDELARVLVNGPMPVAEVVQLRATAVHGVRLRPGTLPRLGPIVSLSAIRGIDVTVHGPGRADDGGVRDRLARWLRRLRADGRLHRDPVVDRALDRIDGAAVGHVEPAVGPRQLQRRFAVQVGLSPQETAGVLRQSQLARSLRRPSGSELAVLAVEHGYSDQSHMTRAFARLAGLPPAAFRREAAGDGFVQDGPPQAGRSSTP